MSTGDRFKNLDSWRGICALAVVLFHFPILGGVRAFPLVSHAWLFVDFFFVLSGFVIASAYEDRLTTSDERWRFMLRRFGRLWPLHVTILAVFVAMSAAKGEIGANERHSVAAILTNLVMIHGLGLHKALTWNGPSWSISVEFTLYGLFAMLSTIKRRPGAYLLLAVAGVGVLLLAAPQGGRSTFDFGLYRGLAGFFTGVLIHRLPGRALGSGAELVAAAAVLLFAGFGRWVFLAPLVFGFAVYVFARSRGAVSRILSRKPMAALGTWSYSIYMVHSAVVALIWAASPRLGLSRVGPYLQGPHGDFWAAPYLAMVILLAATTYWAVENPGRRMFAKLAAAWRPSAPGAQPARVFTHVS